MERFSFTRSEIKSLCRVTPQILRAALPEITTSASGLSVKADYSPGFGTGDFSLIYGEDTIVTASFNEEYHTEECHHHLGKDTTRDRFLRLKSILARLIDEVNTPKVEPVAPAALWLDEIEDPEDTLIWMGASPEGAISGFFSQGPSPLKDEVNPLGDEAFIRMAKTTSGKLSVVEIFSEGSIVMVADNLEASAVIKKIKSLTGEGSAEPQP